MPPTIFLTDAVVAFALNLANVDVKSERAIVDVEYEEISSANDDSVITNPARLITEQSMTPYSVEQRRRDSLLRAYLQMQAKIESILRDFHYKVWIHPRGINKCPCRWEHVADDNITEAFTDFEETVYDALEKLDDFAFECLSDLSLYFGFDDAEVDQIRIENAEQNSLLKIRNAFDYDLKCLLDPTFDPNADLPF